MSLEEESPILITSEDEDDGDEVQYIKEEKAPAITIDENDDQEQDDVIFVSTCPAPMPTLPPTWDESLGLSDALDLDAFTMTTAPAPSCSSSLHHLTPSSNLTAPFIPLTSLVRSDSQDLASVQSLVQPTFASINKDEAADCSLPIDDSLAGLSAAPSITVTHFSGLESGLTSVSSCNSIAACTSSVSVPSNPVSDSSTRADNISVNDRQTNSRFSDNIAQVIRPGPLDLRPLDKDQYILCPSQSNENDSSGTHNGSACGVNITPNRSLNLSVTTNPEKSQHLHSVAGQYLSTCRSGQPSSTIPSTNLINISQVDVSLSKNTVKGQTAVSSDVFGPLPLSVLNNLLDDLPIVDGIAKITNQGLSSVILPLSKGPIGATSSTNVQVSFTEMSQSSSKSLCSMPKNTVSGIQVTSVSCASACSSSSSTFGADSALQHTSSEHSQSHFKSDVQHFTTQDNTALHQSKVDGHVLKPSVSCSDHKTGPKLKDNGLIQQINGNCSSSSDFFDKLLNSCNSILTETAGPASGQGGNVSNVNGVSNKQVQISRAGPPTNLPKKVSKHQSPTPLCNLSNYRLPPRKRVRFSLDCCVSTAPMSQAGGDDLQGDGAGTLKCATSSCPAIETSSDNRMDCDAGSKSNTDSRSVLRSCMQCRKLEGEKGNNGELYTLAQCPNLHTACGECLMVQAKRVLSGKQKESLTCIIETCNSFYPINELKNSSLPPVIVEILQERLDQEMVDFVDKMIASSGNDSSQQILPVKKLDSCIPQSSDCLYHSNSVMDMQSDMSLLHQLAGNDLLDECCDLRKQDKYRDFPSHWQWIRQDDSKNLLEVLAVPVEADSDEYRNVVLRFHEAMAYPQVDVTKVIRIQNPYLWKSYSLKREQMLQENSESELNEFQLFHGTKTNTIDAICRRGFDWRFCGKHGTAYGQGSYFAGDSLYSNHYTDRGTVSSGCSLYLKTVAQVNNSSLLPRSVPAPTPQPPPRSLLTRPALGSSTQAASQSVGKSVSSLPADLALALQQKSFRLQRARLLASGSVSNSVSLHSQTSGQQSQPVTMQSKYSTFSSLSTQHRYSYFSASSSSSQHGSCALQSSSQIQPASASPPGSSTALSTLAKHLVGPTTKKGILRPSSNSGLSATGISVTNNLTQTLSGASSAMTAGSFLGSVSNAMNLSGAASLALMTANSASSLSGNSYLLIAPPTSSLPLALVPAPTQNSHLQVHVSSSVPSLIPKPSPWPLAIGVGSGTSSNQALDLRKALVPRYMFLARVLTGRATQGSPDLRRPPPVDLPDPLGPCYDSCVDRLDQPRIWVIFDSTQAYPEYAIEYQVNSDMYR